MADLDIKAGNDPLKRDARLDAGSLFMGVRKVPCQIDQHHSPSGEIVAKGRVAKGNAHAGPVR